MIYEAVDSARGVVDTSWNGNNRLPGHRRRHRRACGSAPAPVPVSRGIRDAGREGSDAWRARKRGNSGVIHAGFYYSADSLKARFTREGNLALTHYCEEKRLPLNRCGKLVVAKDEQDLPLLDEPSARRAQRRAPGACKRGGRKTDRTSRQDIRARDLFAEHRHGRSARGARRDAGGLRGGRCDRAAWGCLPGPGRSLTADLGGALEAGYVVNAAGFGRRPRRARLRLFGAVSHLAVQGLYLYWRNRPEHSVRTSIRCRTFGIRFFGVHFTVTVKGQAKIGPTAIPAFWREQYHGLDNFRAAEFFEILAREASLFAFSGFDFQRLSIEELKK